MPAQPRRPTKERVIRVLQEAREMRQSSSGSSLNKNSRFKEQPPRHTKRVTFSKPAQPPIKENEMQCGLGLTSCLITSSTTDQRQSGGANNPNERKVTNLARTDSECQYKAPGIDFLTFHDTTVTTHEVQLNPSAPVVKNMKHKCDFFPKYVDPRPFKDQTTQTLYRESSAQTVAYLPEILDKELVNDLEIFNLPTILPGDNPPGLYEVEVLERARKRWAFNKALKTNFRRKMQVAREEAMNSKYKTILEALEWEHWIEREEHIQECQMMRLEIVIRMFDKREKEMHENSKTRIEMACERIEKERRKGLRKNEIEYQRGIRRLEAKLSRTSRKWHKVSPTYALGSPCSEFYGPMMRHGVDPARRHFVGIGQKTFDMRIDELEKRVDMTKLQCPFTKLREWSKPKEFVKEYEQNFCSDNNLQKLYESLKGLRTQATKIKMVPKCLKHRPRIQTDRDSIMRLTYEYEGHPIEMPVHRGSQTDIPGYTTTQEMAFMENYREQKHYVDPEMASKLLAERRQEALENVLNQYEGSFIGWIMQFLSEEMERLKEQRKLHFFSILAQKERWRREAAEAGLRQKENDMRVLYEEMFQQSNHVHNDVAKEYIDNILSTDMANIADCKATETITGLAKQIDNDIKKWLDSFKSIQTPMNYVSLREMLRDFIFPDLNTMLKRYENSLIAKYIVEDVLMAKVWRDLEPYDIVSALTSDLIDRLIDNDLYLFSTDSEAEDGLQPRTSWLEARAIIRKLIRQATPGQRWKDETERVCHEIYNDIFDDIFINMLLNIQNPAPVRPSELIQVRSIASQSLFKDTDDLRVMQNLHKHVSEIEGSSLTDTQIIRIQILTLLKKLKKDKITRVLDTDDQYRGDDQHEDANDVLLHTEVYKKADVNSMVDMDDMFSIISTLDISKETNLRDLKHNMPEEEESSTLSDIGINFGPRTSRSPRTPKTPKTDTHRDLLMSILKDIVSSDYEYDEEGEEEDEYVPQTSASEYDENDEEPIFSSDHYEEEETAEDKQKEVKEIKHEKVKTARSAHLGSSGVSMEAQLTSRLIAQKPHSTQNQVEEPEKDVKKENIEEGTDIKPKESVKEDLVAPEEQTTKLSEEAMEDELVAPQDDTRNLSEEVLRENLVVPQAEKNQIPQEGEKKDLVGTHEERNKILEKIEIDEKPEKDNDAMEDAMPETEAEAGQRIGHSISEVELREPTAVAFGESPVDDSAPRSTVLSNRSNKSQFSLLERASDVRGSLPHASVSHFSSRLSATESQKTSEYAVVLQTEEAQAEGQGQGRIMPNKHPHGGKLEISNESQRE